MTDISPMLATPGTELPRGEGWVFEPKYDGIRILAFADHDHVALLSRNGLDKTRQFPEVADALRAQSRRAMRPFVADGEIVAMDGESPARFQALQSRMHVMDQRAIEQHREDSPAALILFDLLMDGMTSVVGESWRSRRKRLTDLLAARGDDGTLRLTDVSEDGEAMLREARRREWEGLIAKRADAPYEVGRRSRAWLKVKLERRQEFVVGGWTEPRNSRAHIGAILLGYYSDGAFVYAGHTGTGFSNASLADMYRRLRGIERATSPFATRPKTNQPAHWTEPSVVVEIKFNEWTSAGILRQPVFLGVRDDKNPREVVNETAVAAEAKSRSSGRSSHEDDTTGEARVRANGSRRVAASAKTAKPAKAAKSTKATKAQPGKAKGAPGRPRAARDAERVAQQLQEMEDDNGEGTLTLPTGTLDVSNLDKIFFPKTKHTKGDVMRFYARMSPYLLPAIAGRPLVMKRFPNGVTGKAFYQQKAPDVAPPLVRIEPVSDEGLTTQNRIIGGDLATLLYVVQLGAISIDPWHSRTESIQFADYAIIDLDPGPRATFERVIEVARAVKLSLDRFGLHAVPKTSGASGLHIVLPLGPHVPNDGARMIAELVATDVAERYPKIATIERAVKARPPASVYVDFLQNIRGKTVAGVYSVRAQPTPTVSTPLEWSEIDDDLDPEDFTIDNVAERVRKVGDLWAKGMKKPNSLKGVTGGR